MKKSDLQKILDDYKQYELGIMKQDTTNPLQPLFSFERFYEWLTASEKA